LQGGISTEAKRPEHEANHPIPYTAGNKNAGLHLHSPVYFHGALLKLIWMTCTSNTGWYFKWECQLFFTSNTWALDI